MKFPENYSDTPSLGHIQSKSIREHVLDMLNAAIINGDLKPGKTLVEADLAAQFGVSRAPIREAINTLSAQGLVETVPYHGTTVKKLARKDIEELYSIRSLMEGFAIQRIITSGNAQNVAADLREICTAMLTAADSGELKEVNQVDRHFHDTLIHASEHGLLVMLWRTVGMRVRQVMALRNQSKGDLHQIARNHIIIVEAIEREDINEAVDLIHEHIGMTGDLIAEGWEEDAVDTNISSEKKTSP